MNQKQNRKFKNLPLVRLQVLFVLPQDFHDHFWVHKKDRNSDYLRYDLEKNRSHKITAHHKLSRFQQVPSYLHLLRFKRFDFFIRGSADAGCLRSHFKNFFNSGVSLNFSTVLYSDASSEFVNKK